MGAGVFSIFSVANVLSCSFLGHCHRDSDWLSVDRSCGYWTVNNHNCQWCCGCLYWLSIFREQHLWRTGWLELHYHRRQWNVFIRKQHHGRVGWLKFNTSGGNGTSDNSTSGGRTGGSSVRPYLIILRQRKLLTVYRLWRAHPPRPQARAGLPRLPPDQPQLPLHQEDQVTPENLPLWAIWDLLELPPWLCYRSLDSRANSSGW